MSSAVFELTTVPLPGGEQGIPVVQVRGEVDVTNAPRLQQTLTGLASGALIVDLSGAGYFDSAGFAVLDHLLSQASLAVVASPGSAVRAAMSLLHMPFHDTIDAARASLHAG